MNQTPHNQADMGPERAAPQSPYQTSRPAAEPDLDANAPYLRSADVQRLNRKALLFLAGIVVLMLLVVFWIFSGGLSSKDDQDQAPAKGEQVVIPAAPRDLPDLPPEAPPVPMEPDLPPLPVVDNTDRPTASMMAMPSGLPDRQEPSLRERRMLDMASTFGEGQPTQAPQDPGMADYAAMLAGQAGQAPATPREAPDGMTSAKPLYNPNTLLLRGTYIRCALESRVITDVPGYTSCVVTEPVYSVNGKRLLLPRGSKVMGSYNSEAIIGERAAIVWDRITTPTGMDVNMRSPGTDMLGAAGNPGHYSAHWAQRISSALLISMLSDAFKYAGAKNGPQETSIVNGAIVQNPYESNTARTMERLANMALDRNMARPPTVTINQGTIVNVYVARDVDFSAVMR